MPETLPIEPLTDEQAAQLEASVVRAVEDCGGDPVAAVRGLIILNDAMQRELGELRREVEEITAKVSRAYARDLFHHRLTSSDRRSED